MLRSWSRHSKIYHLKAFQSYQISYKFTHRKMDWWSLLHITSQSLTSPTPKISNSQKQIHAEKVHVIFIDYDCSQDNYCKKLSYFYQNCTYFNTLAGQEFYNTYYAGNNLHRGTLPINLTARARPWEIQRLFLEYWRWRYSFWSALRPRASLFGLGGILVVP